MKKSLNRKFSAVLALVLAFAMMVGAVPFTVFANVAIDKEQCEEKMEAIKVVVDDIAANYDEYYKDGYVKAEEAGYIDTAVNAIDEAINAINGLDLTGVPADWAELINPELAATVATLEELKGALTTASDVEGLKAAVLALEDDLNAHLANLSAIWAKVDAEYVTPAIEAAIEFTKTEVIPAVKEAVNVIAEKTYEAIVVALGDAYDAFVEAFFAFLPVADEALYNYFYNNPETVIEFVKTYGPCLMPLVEEYGDEAICFLGYIFCVYGDDMVNYVIENHETVLAALVEWANTYGERTVAMLQVYAEALGLCDAVRDQIAALEATLNNLYAQLENAVEETKAAIEAEIAKVEAAIAELKAQIINKIESIINKQIETVEEAIAALNAAVEAAIAEVKAAIEALVFDATHANITIDNEFKYVALGDNTVVAEGYAEELVALLNKGANENGVKDITFVNAAIAGNTVANEIANLSADVADADLITLGFSQTEIMANAMAAVVNGETIDWAALVGEDVVPYVESALAKITAMIAEQNIPAETAEALTALVTAYAYGVAEYAVNLPALINAIREVNADAEIVIVGMYNPIDGVVIDVDNAFVSVYMDLSDYANYFDYLIDASAAYSFGLAVAIDGVNYVDAREVEITETELGLSALEGLLEGDVSFMLPGEAGHAYIAEQIYNALIIAYDTILWGDADQNGVVDNLDAMIVLQYAVGLVDETKINLVLSDVNGDGKVNNRDAMMIMQLAVGLIEKFPVEA